jgi:hypothetical protein
MKKVIPVILSLFGSNARFSQFNIQIKNMLRLILFIILPIVGFAQSSPFEGSIQYNLKYHDQTGSMTDAQADMFIGTEQLYQIKGDHYRSAMNGRMNMVQLYIGNDTLYNTMQGRNALLYMDATTSTDSVLSHTITDSEEKIAGFACKVLKVNSKEGVSTYWFSDQVRVDPKLYQKHLYGLFGQVLQWTNGALPLKNINETKQFKIEILAKTVTKEALDSGIFILPQGLPRIPMPK